MGKSGSGKDRDARQSISLRREGGFIPPQRTGALSSATRRGGGSWEPWVPPREEVRNGSARGRRRGARSSVRAGRRAGGSLVPRARSVCRGGAGLRADQAALRARRPLAQACSPDRRARVPDREVRRVRPQVQGRDDGALDARLRRGLRVALGASVRDRLRAPDPRPRARTRLRATAPGSPDDRAALHPVPRRGDRHERASRRRLEGGAGGARRPDPRIGRCGGLLDRGRGDRLGDASWASRSSGSS